MSSWSIPSRKQLGSLRSVSFPGDSGTNQRITPHPPAFEAVEEKWPVKNPLLRMPLEELNVVLKRQQAHFAPFHRRFPLPDHSATHPILLLSWNMPRQSYFVPHIPINSHSTWVNYPQPMTHKPNGSHQWISYTETIDTKFLCDWELGFLLYCI